MGHLRLGNSLPRTMRWQEVPDLVGAGGGSAAVASATLDAIEQDLAAAADDLALDRSGSSP